MESFNLSILDACNQDWNNFTPAQGGKHCSLCDKIVIDFTNKGESEIIAFLKNKPSNVCGRFRQEQLKYYSAIPLPIVQPGGKLLRASFILLLLAGLGKVNAQSTPNKLSKSHVEAQVNHDIKSDTSRNATSEKSFIVAGTVLSDDGSALPGANIYLDGSTHGTVSDADGRFKFPVALKAGDILTVSFIGYETQQFRISSKADNLNITMKLDTIVLMGKVMVEEMPIEKHTSFLSKTWSHVKAIFQ